MARRARVGSGGRAAALRRSLAKRRDVRNPKALAAWLGRRKFGKRRFAKMAAAGRRRRGR